MGLVLGFWLAVTIGAPVVAPWLAARVERAEIWLGLDRNETDDAPEAEP